MKLALLGYGKMGKAIETIALERGHSVGVTIDDEDDWMDKIEDLRQCDMAIDFSTPDTAVSNIMRCFDLDMPIVVGTTGWYDQLESVVHDCQQRGKALFVASNFSIGMNIMFELNRRLAQLMDRYDQYQVSITETHHIHKLDGAHHRHTPGRGGRHTRSGIRQRHRHYHPASQCQKPQGAGLGSTARRRIS